MRRTRVRSITGGLVGALLVVGLGGCTDDGGDPEADPSGPPGASGSASAAGAGSGPEDETGLLSFTAEDAGRYRTPLECASFGGPRARIVMWARVEAAAELRLGQVTLRGSGANPGASLEITTTVAPDPGPEAPDYGVSRDGVPGTAFTDPALEDLGDPTTPEGRAAAGAAWEERRPARGAVLEPGTHYVFLDLDALRGFELRRPGLTWSVPEEGLKGTAALPRVLRGSVRCGA